MISDQYAYRKLALSKQGLLLYSAIATVSIVLIKQI